MYPKFLSDFVNSLHSPDGFKRYSRFLLTTCSASIRFAGDDN
jgi:hypothetical protein